jgi:hypothetical protein
MEPSPSSGAQLLIARLQPRRGVAPAQHPTSFLLGSKAAPRIQPEAARTLALLMALGELHGRNLASAFMRSRVHNRTRDRGGKPIRLGVAVGIAPVLPEGVAMVSRQKRYRTQPGRADRSPSVN